MFMLFLKPHKVQVASDCIHGNGMVLSNVQHNSQCNPNNKDVDKCNECPLYKGHPYWTFHDSCGQTQQ